jgi:chromosomal replication initiator protein
MSFNPKYTFDTFIEGSNNRLALAPRRQSPKRLQKNTTRCSSTALPAGLKTHLMQAIAQSILSDNPRCKVVFISSEKFTNDLIETIRNKTNYRVPQKYRSADVLLVDDISSSRARNRRRKNFSTRSTIYTTRENRSSSLPINRPRTSKT